MPWPDGLFVLECGGTFAFESCDHSPFLGCQVSGLGLGVKVAPRSPRHLSGDCYLDVPVNSFTAILVPSALTCCPFIISASKACGPDLRFTQHPSHLLRHPDGRTWCLGLSRPSIKARVSVRLSKNGFKVLPDAPRATIGPWSRRRACT